MDLSAIQSALRSLSLDAWLFYAHPHRDPIAYRVLGLPESLHVTRRWYYLIPAQGEPQKLVHRIESHHLDSLPGKYHEYSTWQEQHAALREMASTHTRIAMQYSPNNAIPYIGLVDAGTVELIRSFGPEIVPSGDLVSQFEAVWTPEQIRSHYAARDSVDRIIAGTFAEIGRRVRHGGTNEFETAEWVREQLRREDMTDASREVIRNAGYGDRFVHRTGHSIGAADVHGNGANMDNLETHDDRAILPNSCFSVEPGIYLTDDFGVRSEVNVLIENGQAVITGAQQSELVRI